ncbi:MAG: hypothetical protein U1F61_10805 [Opitutaceae bacterium]
MIERTHEFGGPNPTGGEQEAGEKPGSSAEDESHEATLKQPEFPAIFQIA